MSQRRFSRPLFSRRRALAGFGSLIAGSPLLKAQQAQPVIGEPPGRIAPIEELINTLEFEAVAERKLEDAVFAAIAGGDRKGFDRIIYRPRLMVNSLEMDLSSQLFGDTMFAPIVVGPASHQRRFHPQGESAMARGAAGAKAALVVADRSDTPIEKVAAEAQTPLWYQVYPEPKADALMARVRRAVRAGCKAVCITVGTPQPPIGAGGSPRLSERAALGHPALDWDYIDRIRQEISVPLLLKGIMTAEEARTAVERGVEGVIVSNHGGGFVEGLAEPISVLPAIADAVGEQVPILIDGGFRRGSDVLKALALGARAVLISRPALWGLAAYGARGVQTVVELLQTELGRDMAMCGAVNLRAVTRDFIKVDRR